MYNVDLKESYFPAQMGSQIAATTVGGVLRTAAANSPNAIALVEADISGDLGREWSYTQLLSDSENLARALLSRFKHGEKVVVWAPNIPEWIMLEYATALAGIVLVTANPAFQPRELEYVVAQSGAVGLFYVDEFRGNPMGKIATVLAAKNKDLREIANMEKASELFKGSNTQIELPDVQPDDPAQIQYTSGTTGFPKGAILHHRGLTNNARLCYERIGAKKGQTFLSYMPLFHTTGCALAVLGACQNEARLILAKLFDPGRMLDIIESEKASYMSGVPTMLLAMLQVQAAQPRDLSHIEGIGSGGSMVSPELVRMARDMLKCPVQPIYGQTETSPVLTQVWSDDSFEDMCGTIGQALPQTEMSIRDPKTNKVLPIGEQGEICARGYCVMTGYNNNPAATAATIDADNWLHTGDLGTMDSRGYIRITGRVKEMIIRGGENMFPAEIENVMLEHKDVADIAIVGIPDEKWGEILAAFIRPTPGATLDKHTLVAHCRAHLAAPKTPAHWIEIDEWPLTGSGKIQRFVLRDQFVAGEFVPI
ncbi:MAG: AMP-binding protein [Hyphomonadaceae bacterium]|nr:AMP-binding protein [Hyphomonadaceae bacterium]